MTWKFLKTIYYISAQGRPAKWFQVLKDRFHLIQSINTAISLTVFDIWHFLLKLFTKRTTRPWIIGKYSNTSYQTVYFIGKVYEWINHYKVRINHLQPIYDSITKQECTLWE